MTQVGEGLQTIQQCEAAAPVDTDYIELELAGLAEARASLSQVGGLLPTLSKARYLQLTSIIYNRTITVQVGGLVSSSCIPARCVAGGDGLRRAVAGRRTTVTLTTRDAVDIIDIL